MSKFYQIRDFRKYLKHPEKYLNINNKPLRARSGLEITKFTKVDSDPKIIKWSSETIIIPYQKPIFESKNIISYTEQHKYIVDLYLQYQSDINNIVELLVEIKPLSQVYKPKEPKHKTAEYYKRLQTWEINQAKWKATKAFCDDMTNRGRKINFIIFTENTVIEYKG